MTQMQNRIVYITGDSSGIGLAVARHVAALGAHVGVFARDPDKLARAAETVRSACAQSDQTVFSSTMDVNDRDDVATTCAQALAEFGVPDILITSAGIPMAGRFENTDADRFNALLQTNLYGTRHVIAALLPAMKARGGGHIVPVSSSAGLFGVYGFSAYCASKFALVGLAECLRSELLNDNIRVSIFCPPEVDTPLFGSGKRGSAARDPDAKEPGRYVERGLCGRVPGERHHQEPVHDHSGFPGQSLLLAQAPDAPAGFLGTARLHRQENGSLIFSCPP